MNTRKQSKKSTSSILSSLTQFHPRHLKHTRINLDLYLKTITLFLFSQIDSVNAKFTPDSKLFFDLYHTISETFYRIKYPADPTFMVYLTGQLATNCDALISALPTNFNFTNAANLHCSTSMPSNETTIDILVKAEDQFSPLFISCCNNAIQTLCDMNNNPSASSDSNNIDNLLLYFIPLIIFICLVPLVLCLSKKKENTLLNNTTYPFYDDQSRSDSDAGLTKCCLSKWSSSHSNSADSAINHSEVIKNTSKNAITSI